MNLSNLDKIIKGKPAFYKREIQKALFFNYIEDWHKLTVLPNDLREQLAKECSLEIEAKIFKSKDNFTEKALITLGDSSKIETVLMKHKDGHNTICVSTQVGCQMACLFCATGQMGFKRNLTVEEIMAQLVLWQRVLQKQNKKVDNIVFMGMGEPFLNYDNVLESIELIKTVSKIGARHISVSTVGIIEEIIKFAKDQPQVNLAISLHAPNNELRSELIPANNQWPIEKVMKAINDYVKITNRKVMFEYLMLKGVNDSGEQARELAQLVKGKLFVLNLIKYNPTGKYKSSDREVIDKFKAVLEKEGVNVTERFSFGQDIKAACGQLASK